MKPKTPYPYRYRIYPNRAQRQYLARVFGCVRYVYNWALDLRINTYNETGEDLHPYKIQKILTKYKKQKGLEWLDAMTVSPLQQAIADNHRAFENYFERRTLYPRFKRKRSRQSARFVRDRFWLEESPYGPKLHLAKLPEGPKIKVHWHRPMNEEPSSCTVVQERDGRYYVSFVTKRQMTPLPKTKAAVGIDLGLTDVVVTSDGWKSGNPRLLEKAQKRLRREQKKLSRKKKKGTHNRERQKRRVAKAHAKVKDARKTWIHKLTKRLVKEYDLICIESLAVKNMMQNRCLARGISDVAWGELVRQLEYKADWYGKEVVKIDRFFPSSKTCSCCGHKRAEMPLDVRHWTCKECGAEHDRDINAAKNICRAGLARTGSHRASKSALTAGKSERDFVPAGTVG